MHGMTQSFFDRRTEGHIFLTQRRKERGAICSFVLMSKKSLPDTNKKIHPRGGWIFYC